MFSVLSSCVLFFFLYLHNPNLTVSQRVLRAAEWATLIREVIRQELTKQCLSEKVSILHYFIHSEFISVRSYVLGLMFYSYHSHRKRCLYVQEERKVKWHSVLHAGKLPRKRVQSRKVEQTVSLMLRSCELPVELGWPAWYKVLLTVAIEITNINTTTGIGPLPLSLRHSYHLHN